MAHAVELTPYEMFIQRKLFAIQKRRQRAVLSHFEQAVPRLQTVISQAKSEGKKFININELKEAYL